MSTIGRYVGVAVIVVAALALIAVLGAGLV